MKIIIFLALLFVSSNFIFCQNTLATAAGETAGDGGSSSFTIGQLVYTTNIESDGNLAQGIQQAFEFQVPNSVNTAFENYKIATYPNPTTNYFTVEISENLEIDLNFALLDIRGSLISSGKFARPKTEIKVQHLAKGLYFLKVLQQEQSLKTFQIIKI